MEAQIKLGDIVVDVVLKDIKNVNLRVFPPTGRVRITAPRHVTIDTLRVFAVSKLDWIKKQQAKLRNQPRETPRKYVDRESHYVWGKRYLLTVLEADKPALIALQDGRMILRVPPGTNRPKKKALVERWYREQIKMAVPPLLERWQPQIGVKTERFFVRRMKTLWGSCNPKARTIRLNTELAKKPEKYLEYIVVHELAHMQEPSHNARFRALMDRLIPSWRLLRGELNRAPLPGGD